MASHQFMVSHENEAHQHLVEAEARLKGLATLTGQTDDPIDFVTGFQLFQLIEACRDKVVLALDELERS